MDWISDYRGRVGSSGPVDQQIEIAPAHVQAAAVAVAPAVTPIDFLCPIGVNWCCTWSDLQTSVKALIAGQLRDCDLSAEQFTWLGNTFFASSISSALDLPSVRTFWMWLEQAIALLQVPELGCMYRLRPPLLHGFVDCSGKLVGCNPGTFLIRFSRSYPGDLALDAVGVESQRIRYFAGVGFGIEIDGQTDFQLFDSLSSLLDRFEAGLFFYPALHKRDHLQALQLATELAAKGLHVDSK
jgi:hypothetical protein